MRSSIREFQFASLLTVVVVLAVVKSSPYWEITNQIKLESRPYTQTSKDPSTSGPTFRSTNDIVQQAKFREMHRYCDGQCFYAPPACVEESNLTNCRVSASISMHNEDRNGDLFCDFFGQDNLRQSFCSSSAAQRNYRANHTKSVNQTESNFDRFYTITVHRVLESGLTGGDGQLSCRYKWNAKTGRKCRRSEFVAISFVNKEAPDTDLHVDDLWYVCFVDETHSTRISMWTNINSTGPVEQILGTKPHLASGAGVIFSKVTIDEDLLSMSCQFVIQESNMTLLYPPKNAAFFSNKSQPIRVKFGTGIAERSLDDSIQRPFFTDNGRYAYYVYRGDQVKPTDQIYFDSLNVDVIDPVANPKEELKNEKDNADAIEGIIEKCNKPMHYPELHIACYPPKFQQNCVHTGRCPVMLIVELPKTDVSFKTIKVHLYSLVPDYKSLRKVERPTGFASVGFSLDNKMGRDVVISCHADGINRLGVYVSINYEKTNVYPGKVDYNNLIYNTQTFATVNKSRILCSWEMNTKFVVNTFEYQPDYRSIILPGESEKLEFDFSKQPVHLLIAAGNRNYPDGKIVHHDFRQVLDKKFSKKLFLETATGSRLELYFYPLMVIVTRSVLSTLIENV